MKKLGILGGMGPAASAEFITRIINKTPRFRGVYYFFKFHSIDIQAFERVSKNSIS